VGFGDFFHGLLCFKMMSGPIKKAFFHEREEGFF